MRTRFCLLLVIALTGSPLIAGSLGGLTVSGKVWTNQVALPSGSSVYAGDRIQTDADGIAVLGGGAHRVEIRPDSLVTLRGDSLDLHRGAAGSSGSDIVLGDTAVSAEGASDDSWFVVSETDGQVLVAAYRGDAVIRERDGRRTVVPAGSFAMAAAAPQAQSGAAGGSTGPAGSAGAGGAGAGAGAGAAAAGAGAAGAGAGAAGAGAQAAATAASGWSLASLSATSWALIGAGGAVAATAGVVANGESVSPQ